jgi:hypothetical protein
MAVKPLRPLNRAVSLQALRVNQATQSPCGELRLPQLSRTTCELLNSVHVDGSREASANSGPNLQASELSSATSPTRPFGASGFLSRAVLL